MVRSFITCQCIAIVFLAGGRQMSAQTSAAQMATANNGTVPSSNANIVVLTGTAGEKTTITATELATLPRTTIRVFDAHTKTQETYSGVQLSDLLARVNAPLGERLHGKAMGTRVIAEGSDHYTALYSLAEIDPAFHPGTVIIADMMDGKPLPPSHGPLQLVNTEDKRPARWVRQLIAVRLVAAE